MIDYTQYAFQRPARVSNPTPSVADYLQDYEARNAAWYDQWAYPIGPGQWGARPESFVVRAPWTEDLLPPETMPEVLKETDGNLTTDEFGTGSTTTRPGDMPLGQMVQDPAEMTDDELWSTYGRLTSPEMEYGSMVPGAVMGLASGVPGLAFMGRAGVRDYADRVGREMQNRITTALALGTALPSPANAINPNIQFARVGTPTVVDAGPSDPVVARLATGPDIGGGMFERVGTPSTEPEQRSDADRADDRGYGGGSEVGAGGWAGSGGL